MSFKIFNQYQKNRSISNESHIDLTHEILAKKDLSRSTSHWKRTTSVAEKLEQFKSWRTISSFQTLQMLFRWLIIMFASETSEMFLLDEYNITKFFDRYADLCLNYDLEERKDSSFFSLLWFKQWAVCENRDQRKRLRI
jgi:hypothetical protein